MNGANNWQKNKAIENTEYERYQRAKSKRVFSNSTNVPAEYFHCDSRYGGSQCTSE
jgi:hypothetical protein